MTEVRSHIVWSDDVARTANDRLARAELVRTASRPWWKRAARTLLLKSRQDKKVVADSMMEAIQSIHHNSISMRASIDQLESQGRDLVTVINSTAQDQLIVRADVVDLEKEIDSSRSEFVEAVSALSARVARLSADLEASTKQETAIQYLRGEVGALKKSLEQSSRPAHESGLPTVSPEKGQITDELYARLEDRLRGTQDEIKDRLAEYLPVISKLPSPELLVIDVGCGRGEWLELLQENSILARGVDLNQHFVAEDTSRGLDVVFGDANEYLRSLEPGSVRAITGFHIIEHLPVTVFLDLLESAQQALMPGGQVMFETPNPTNVMVGAANFYLDPSHIRPVHPAFAEFLATAVGFSESEILYLHPAAQWPQVLDRVLKDVERTEFRHLWDVINGPQDFCLVATK